MSENWLSASGDWGGDKGGGDPGRDAGRDAGGDPGGDPGGDSGGDPSIQSKSAASAWFCKSVKVGARSGAADA